jgi:RNA polymerase sigma-70 factor, ECF subfamily
MGEFEASGNCDSRIVGKNPENIGAPPSRQTVFAFGAAQIKSIVERIRAGEHELFLDLVHPHLTMLHKILRSLMRNDFEVQDVLQQTLLQAYLNLGQLRSVELFRPWLCRIAINEMHKVRRVNRSDRLFSSIDEPLRTQEENELIPRNIADQRETPAERFEREELARLLHAQFAKLPKHWQKVLFLHDIENMSVTEIAEGMNESEKAVKMNLHRARFHLRELLTEHGCTSREQTARSVQPWPFL